MTDSLREMRALVTGCAGFIGSHLTESLLSDGHEVVGVDCFNDNYGRAEKRANLTQALAWDSFDFVPLDLSRGNLHDLVEECDAVFHLAAEPGVRSGWGARFESYVRNNLTATQHLLAALTRTPQTRFVYASSSSVYGQAATLPTPEDAPLVPASPYGVTKLAAEQLVHAYHVGFGIESVSLRFFSVYGPRQRPDMAFSRFCLAALREDPVTVFGDGSQTRDFAYVGDVVEACCAACDAPAAAGGVYNVGGGSRVSVNDAIGLLGELAGRSLRVEYQEVEKGDVKDTGADTSRAQRDLGFDPQTSFADGLRAQFEHAVAVAASSV